MISEPRSERRHHSLIPERSAVLLNVNTSLGPVAFGANGLEGFIEAAVDGERIDAGVLPVGHLELRVDRLTSGNSAYDGELRRQIDARRFPTAYVELYRAVPVDPASETFGVAGEITLRGVTVGVEGVVAARFAEPGRLVVIGEGGLHIDAFGIPPPSLFMIKIDPEVKIALHLEAQAEPGL